MGMQEYGSQAGYGGQPGYGEYQTQPEYTSPPSYGGYGGYGPPPPPPQRPGLLRYVAVAVVSAALGAGVVVGIGHIGSSSTPQAAPASGGSSAPGQQPQQQPQQNQPGQVPVGGNGLTSAQQKVVNQVSPGLVIINTALQYRAEQAAGTGMVINSNGLVLTNNHVIESATSISATVVATGKTYRAKVLGYDKTGDIAAIQLQGASGLHTAPIGNSSAVKTGDAVIGMGNANGGNEIIPAAGQVTALHQTITAQDDNGVDSSEKLHNMIQTSADIISGDSGGAMANSSGQVIGMITAGNNVQFGDQQATGFAIPINTALSEVSQIAAGHGSSTITIGYPPFIGVFIPTSNSNDPQQQAQDQNQGQSGNGFGGGFGGGGGQQCYSNDAQMPVPSQIAPVSSGTLIIGTICNSPAAAAGLTGGDVITAVNGNAIGGPSQLSAALSKYGPGDSVSLTWVNVSGQHQTSTLHLVDGPPQ